MIFPTAWPSPSQRFSHFFLAAAPCLPCKPCVLRLLRTLFLSLHSFRRSPRLFSIACGLFVQNTGVWGTSATSPRPPRLCVTICFFLSALYFHQLTNPPSSRIDLQHLCFHSFTNPFFRNLFVFTSIQNPGGVGSKLWLTTDSVTPTQVAAASSEESKNSIVTNETLE